MQELLLVVMLHTFLAQFLSISAIWTRDGVDFTAIFKEGAQFLILVIRPVIAQFSVLTRLKALVTLTHSHIRQGYVRALSNCMTLQI